MSWEDKDIDDLFREAADSMRFEYRDAYFDAIDAQLPLRKKRGVWVWFSIVVAAVAVSGVWIFMPSKSTIADGRANNALEATNNQTELKPDASKSVVTKGVTDRDEMNQMNEAKATSVQSKQNSLRVHNLNFKPTIPHYQDLDPVLIFTENEKLAENAANGEDGIASNLDNENPKVLVVENPMDKEQANEAQSNDKELAELQFINSSHDLMTALPNSRIKHKLFVEAGAGFGQSYIRSVENGSNRAANYSLMLGYQHYKGTWSYSFSGGLNHSTFNNLNIADRTEIYGFGLTTYENNYSFRSVTSAQFNVGANYKVKKHQVGVGVNILVPILTRISYNEYENGELISSGSALVDNSYFKISVEPELSYMFSLTKTVDLGLRVYAPLWNPINSDRIKGERAAFPVNGQLLLKWNLGLK